MRAMVDLPVSVAGVHVVVAPGAHACGPYANVVLDFEPPISPGSVSVVCSAPESRVPKCYGEALTRGVIEGLNGVAAAVDVVDGRFHIVDARESAYVLAGHQAARAALVAAGLLAAAHAELRWVVLPALGQSRASRLDS